MITLDVCNCYIIGGRMSYCNPLPKKLEKEDESQLWEEDENNASEEESGEF